MLLGTGGGKMDRKLFPLRESQSRSSPKGQSPERDLHCKGAGPEPKIMCLPQRHLQQHHKPRHWGP